jgi:hypothetical protein
MNFKPHLPQLKEAVMSTAMNRPQVTDDGVAFTVAVGFMKRECLIPRQTLSYISRTGGDDLDCMETFRAHEDAIVAVARRMAISGAANVPIILERRFFLT